MIIIRGKPKEEKTIQPMIDVDALTIGDMLVIRDSKDPAIRLFFPVLSYTLITHNSIPLVTAFKPDTRYESTKGRTLVFNAKTGQCVGSKRYQALGVLIPELGDLDKINGSCLMVEGGGEAIAVKAKKEGGGVLSVAYGGSHYFDALTGHSIDGSISDPNFRLCPVVTKAQGGTIFGEYTSWLDYYARGIDLTGLDFADIAGFNIVKRAFEIASTGNHTIGIISHNLSALAIFSSQADRFDIGRYLAIDTPCPCGGHATEHKLCTCSDDTLQEWRDRPAHKLAAGAEIVVCPSWVDFYALASARKEETTAVVLGRVRDARGVAPYMEHQRLGELPMNCQKIIKSYGSSYKIDQLKIDRILSVARTVATLGQCPTIQSWHIAESLQYQKEY